MINLNKLMKYVFAFIFAFALMYIAYSEEVVQTDDSATTSTISNDAQTTESVDMGACCPGYNREQTK